MKYTFSIIALAITFTIQGQNIDSLEFEKERIERKVDELNQTLISIEDQIEAIKNEQFILPDSSDSVIIGQFRARANLWTESTNSSERIHRFEEDFEAIILEYRGGYLKVETAMGGGYINDLWLKNQKEMIAKYADRWAVINEKYKAEEEAQLKAKEAKWRAEQEAKRKAYREELIRKYGAANAQRILDQKIWIGMTTDMARESWGEPKDINRTVSASYVHEQWVYSNAYLYFENGVLTSWQD